MSDAPTGGACLACGYSMAGLPQGAVCPECGAPSGVQEAFLLRNSDPGYRADLLKGVGFVLNGIVAMVVFMIIGIIVAFATTSSQQNPTVVAAITPLQVGMQLISLLIGLVIAYGWWLFSEADPSLTGQHDGGSPRQVVRICVIISVVASLLSFVVYLLGWLTGSDLLAGVMLMVIGLVSGLAGIVAFFAQMLYVRWLAPRLPNPAVYKRSKTLMWLGPVLYTVGLLLLGLGPLIALVLYWNMLDKVRKDLRQLQGPGFAAAA